MTYRVILTANGKYMKTLHKSRTIDTSFTHYHALIYTNQSVKFPKRFINTAKILPVKYQICVTKITEPNDTFRRLRDAYGRTYFEKPLGDWTILAAEPYEIEETFWIFGLNPKANRPIIDEVVKRLAVGAYKKNMVKQVLVVHNKLVIYNEEQFDMVICKCKKDAQRLHHTLGAIAKKQRIKSLMFMGTATPATISWMYPLIQKETGWSYAKTVRRTTRP